MIVGGDWLGEIIRPRVPDVVKMHGRALSRVLASVRRSPHAHARPAHAVRPEAARPAQAPEPPPGAEDHERDRELMRRVCGHDEEALTALYDRYAATVNGLAVSILRNPALAEEATHDVFLRLWQQPEAYDPARGTFAGWLLRVTRNRCIDLLRRRREETSGTFDADIASWLADPAPGPEEQALAGMRRQDVRQALATLSPDHRRLLELAYFTGLSQAQIAERLGRPLGTVKSQIRAAMARLAEELAPPDGPARHHGPGGSR